MAYRTLYFRRDDGSKVGRYFIFDTAAELLTSTLIVGDIAYTVDTKAWYVADTPTSFTSFGAGGAVGDVVGPASSTDNALVRYNGTTGKLVQNGVITMSDTGDLNQTAAGLSNYYLNSTGSDSDGGRAVSLTFAGKRANSTINNLVGIYTSHDGTANDDKAKVQIFLNDGNDGAFPSVEALNLKSTVATVATPLNVNNSLAASVAVVVKGAASQSANLQNWSNSTPKVLSSVNSVGEFTKSETATSSGALNNEMFGAGAGRAITSGDANSLFGATAGGLIEDGGFNTAVGENALGANISGNFNTAIGSRAADDYTGSNITAVGASALTATTGTGNMGIGYLAGTVNITGARNTYLGNETGSGVTTNLNESIAIGFGAQVTASNQLVIGSGTEEITDAYLGSGVTDASPSGTTLNATGGEGTDIAGAAITIAGGKGTGSAAGGSILFKTSDAGSTGTTLQSLTTKLTLAASGKLTTTRGVVFEGSANNRAVNNRILYGATTDAATAVELTFDGAAGSGATNRIAVPTDTSLSIVLNIGVKQAASANAKQMLRQVVITNNGGTTALSGTPIALGTDTGDAGLATVTTTITANNTDDCLKVEVNGVVGTNLRYTCFVVSTETLYA